MKDSKAFNDSDAKYQADVLLTQLEKICQETPYTRSYVAARLLGIPHAMKSFQHIIANFQSQLIKHGYFHLDKRPEITREQIEDIHRENEILGAYGLFQTEDQFYLVDPKTNQTVYYIHCYPRFRGKSQFWGWRILFKHHKNPRLDISLDCNESVSERLETTDD